MVIESAKEGRDKWKGRGLWGSWLGAPRWRRSQCPAWVGFKGAGAAEQVPPAMSRAGELRPALE